MLLSILDLSHYLLDDPPIAIIVIAFASDAMLDLNYILQNNWSWPKDVSKPE